MCGAQEDSVKDLKSHRLRRLPYKFIPVHRRKFTRKFIPTWWPYSYRHRKDMPPLNPPRIMSHSCYRESGGFSCHCLAFRLSGSKSPSRCLRFKLYHVSIRDHSQIVVEEFFLFHLCCPCRPCHLHLHSCLQRLDSPWHKMHLHPYRLMFGPY